MATKKKAKSTPKQRSNSAKKNLGSKPFRTVSEFKEFRENIRREVSRRLETAKAMEEMTSDDPEYAFFKERFKNGMSCKYGANQDDIVNVSLTDKIEITISEEAKESATQNERELIGQLVKGMSNSLTISYFEAMGYLPVNTASKNPSSEDSSK